MHQLVCVIFIVAILLLFWRKCKAFENYGPVKQFAKTNPTRWDEQYDPKLKLDNNKCLSICDEKYNMCKESRKVFDTSFCEEYKQGCYLQCRYGSYFNL